MVPPPPAADAHADPTWLERVQLILKLSRRGNLIGLEGAHMACAGPLCRVLTADGATSICFSGHELLEVPRTNRVVLLHAARDAEFLNLVRPVVAEHELRVFVWLDVGDRATLRQQAPDFLDWMQQTIDVPAFLPEYATKALARALHDGACITWEGPPLADVVPPGIVWLKEGMSTHDATVAMENGPVVMSRMSVAGERRLVTLYQELERKHGVIWDEPVSLIAGAERIIVPALDWELASHWLRNQDAPRLAAARLDLNPVVLANITGREPPAVFRAHLYVDESRRTTGPLPPPTASRAWEQLYNICQRHPNESIDMLLERPAEAPGLVPQLLPKFSSSGNSRYYTISGASGSGRRSECRLLAKALEGRRLVIPGFHHEYAELAQRGPIKDARWLTPCACGLAAIRFGHSHDVRWGSELIAFVRLVESATERQANNRDLRDALQAITPRQRISPSESQIRAIEQLTSACLRQLRHQLGACLFLASDDDYYEQDPLQQLAEDAGVDVLRWRPLLRPGHVNLHDIPVIDPLDPKKQGSGLDFFRQLTAHRINLLALPVPPIPNAVIDRLALVSGGRPSAFLNSLGELARFSAVSTDEQLTWSEHHLKTQTSSLIRYLHEPLILQLKSLLDETVTSIANWSILNDIYLFRYPTPDGGFRLLPHPLLIDYLEQA